MARIIAVWVLAFLIGPQDDKKAKEDEARKKIDEYHAAIKKAKEESAMVDAINELGKVQHPRILAELKTWLTKPAKEAAAAAAEQMGKYFHDREAAETLITVAAATKDAALATKFVRCAGITKVKGIASRLILLYRHKELDLAHAAIDASGLIKSKDCVSPLIALVKELEAIKPDDGSGAGQPDMPDPGGLGAGGQSTEDQRLKRKEELLDPARQALRDITGEKWDTGKDWETWWRKAGPKFKEQD